jgi:hypothetical protein
VADLRLGLLLAAADADAVAGVVRGGIVGAAVGFAAGAATVRMGIDGVGPLNIAAGACACNPIGFVLNRAFMASTIAFKFNLQIPLTAALPLLYPEMPNLWWISRSLRFHSRDLSRSRSFDASSLYAVECLSKSCRSVNCGFHSRS